MNQDCPITLIMSFVTSLVKIGAVGEYSQMLYTWLELIALTWHASFGLIHVSNAPDNFLFPFSFLHRTSTYVSNQRQLHLDNTYLFGLFVHEIEANPLFKH